MPVFTTLLLIFVALALLPLTLRSREAKRENRRASQLEDKFRLAAMACEVAFRDSFNVELDHTRQSIAILDSKVTSEWLQGTNSESQSGASKESVFLLAAYIGDVLARDLNAEWRRKNEQYILMFPSTTFEALPFELVQKKLVSPAHVDLTVEVNAIYEAVSPSPKPQPPEVPTSSFSDEPISP